MHALGLEFGSAAQLSQRPGSVWNCLWGNALKRSPGIICKSRVSYLGPGLTSFTQRVMGVCGGGAEDICDYAAIQRILGHSLKDVTVKFDFYKTLDKANKPVTFNIP